MSLPDKLPDNVRLQIDRAQRRGLAFGVVGLIATVALAFGLKDWTQFFHSYLVAYVFWMVFAMGCMAILQLHHMTGGRWGLPIRRILEAGTRTIPAMTVLFIPILFGMSRLYPWMQPDSLGDEPAGHFRRVYLEPHFFIVRAVIYFAIWNLLAALLNKWSAEQDRTGDLILKDRMSSLAAPGTILWALSWSWAMVDWVMTLEPTWYSSIYGMVFMVIACLAALSFSVVMLRMLDGYQPLHDSYDPPRLNDIGNLMLTFTLLWTYMSFAQFLIIWSGNLKQEIPWVKVRAFGPWAPVAAALLILHFFVPFFILLQRGVKRRLQRLSVLAAWMLVITLVDVYWLIVPSFQQSGPHIHLLDVFAVIGIGGVWVGVYMAQLKKMPLLPLHDPRFAGVLEHQHGD
jgi:hypothetical protein